MATSVDPIKIGLLFSQSGAFGSTEVEHLRGAILAVADINAGGGVEGRPLQPVICDPASDASRLRRLAGELIEHEDVVSLFGCSSSALRKALLPLVERQDALLWYPTQCEGFEYSPNVFYGGPCPNQHVLPLARHFQQAGYGRVALLGSDYIFPRECNRVMHQIARQYGADIHDEHYLPLNAGPDAVGALLHRWMADPPDVIFSSVVGASALSLFQAYADGGYQSSRTPIATICTTESDIALADPAWFRGHLCSLPYFESLDSADNHAFVARFRHRFGRHARTSFMVESSYVQVRLFALAAALAGRMDAESLRDAAVSVEFAGPRGRARIDPMTHYTHYRPRIGRADGRGHFTVLADDEREISPDPYLVAVP